MTVNNGDSINYVTGTLTVNAKGLTITGFAVNNKTYDGAHDGHDQQQRIALRRGGGDSVSLNSGCASATFDNANVGTTHTVTASGYTLRQRTDAGNYTLTQPTASNVDHLRPRPHHHRLERQTHTYGTSERLTAPRPSPAPACRTARPSAA